MHVLHLGSLPGCWNFPHEHYSHCLDKNMSGVPTTLTLPLPGHSSLSWGDWSHRGGHPSLPAQCQYLCTTKSMGMCLKLRSGNLAGPWSDPVQPIPPLVPEKGFKVLATSVQCQLCSSATNAILASELSVNFWSTQRLVLAESMLIIHPYTVQELLPLNVTLSWRILAPGVRVNPS